MSFMGTNRFGGIMPRIDAGELPLAAAQAAKNVDLTGGNLKAINFPDPVYKLHNAGALVDQIPAGEVVTIAKPWTPTVSTSRMISTLGLSIYAWRFLSFLNPSTQEWTSVSYSEQATIAKTIYNEYGMQLEVTVAPVWFTQLPGVLYKLSPAIFQFRFASANNGPDSTLRFPSDAAMSAQGAQFPQCFMPYSSSSVVFGHFQVVRCDHPSAPEEFYDPHIPDIEGVIRNIPEDAGSSTATFEVDMNYVVSTRRFFYYVQTYVDNSDREGPPSEVSKVMVVPPGHKGVIFTGSSTTTKHRLYRSVDGQEGFRLLGEGTGASYAHLDTFREALGEELPIFGNPPTFAVGNLLHPGQFGVAFTGKEVWFSDAFRLHVWPEEWKVVFETNILAVQLISSSVIVFTSGSSGNNGKVFMLTGSDPRYMGKYEIISTAPMLNKLSMCKIGQSLFYVSNDGLMAVGQDGAQNLTAQHFTRKEWLDLTPANYSAEVADNSIFLTHSGTAPNLRIDLSEEMAKVSVWTARQAVEGLWRSRRFVFPTPTRFTSARVLANLYPIRLTVHDEDAGNIYECEIRAAKSSRLPRMNKARSWSFTVDVPKAGVIEHVAIANSTADLEMVNRAE